MGTKLAQTPSWRTNDFICFDLNYKLIKQEPLVIYVNVKTCIQCVSPDISWLSLTLSNMMYTETLILHFLVYLRVYLRQHAFYFRFEYLAPNI